MDNYENEQDIIEIDDEDLEWDLEDSAEFDDDEAAAWEDGTLALLEEHHEHALPEAKSDLPEESASEEIVDIEPASKVEEEIEIIEPEPEEEIEIIEPDVEAANEQPTEEQLATGIILVDDDQIAEAAAHALVDNEPEEPVPAPRRHSLLDIAIVLAGAAVIVLAALTYTQYQHMQAIETEAVQYASLGSNLAGAGILGEEQIEAIAESRKAADTARAEAAAAEEERQELAENAGTSPVSMTLSTIQSDLKVKFRSESGYLISNVPFKISVTTDAGKTSEYEDDDQDGVIYLTGIASGTYKVAMLPLVDSALSDVDVAASEAYRLYSKYQIPTDTQTIEVTDKIAYEAIDVRDEIKSASEVNVAAEDTQQHLATESSLQDTVEWVASSETTVIEKVEAENEAANAEAASTEAATEATTEDAAAEAGEDTGSESADTASTDIPSEAVEVTDDQTSDGSDTASSGTPNESVEITTTKYTGWQNIDGKTYYYNSNGVPVTGNQVINGAPYTFDDNGVLQSGTSSVGIDVSQWNGSIDWSQVANSGVSYAIIRCGYRGSSSGALIRDSSFSTNIAGATAAGLKVGIYVFSQAVNEIEAVEEASMAIELAAGYNVRLPIFIDVEAASGRADGLSSSERTAVVSAFCQTVQSAGYSAGVYSNTNWFSERLNTPSLTNYHIWVAQYASTLQYARTRYDIWQYSSNGHVAGISGAVDMNMAYRSY